MGWGRFWSHSAGRGGNDVNNDAILDHRDVPTGVGAADYYIAPPTDEVWEVARMLVTIVDAKGFESEEYGSIGGALSTGIKVIISRGGVEQDITAAEPVKSNAGWGHHCYDVQVHAFGNTTNSVLGARWTFSKSGAPIVLKGRDGDKLIVRCNDKLDDLSEHHFIFQGISLAYSD
jgi:hypothetical protein